MVYQHQLLTITFWVPGYACYDCVGGSYTYIRNDLRRKIPKSEMDAASRNRSADIGYEPFGYEPSADIGSGSFFAFFAKI